MIVQLARILNLLVILFGFFFFFFQAEDGIRDIGVTGVQTCALPILMPIRDVEAYFPSSPKRLRILANRGANGIDGVVSSAMGAAIATGLPTWVLLGELALQHDAGGLIAARRAGVELNVLCLNNGGGGIFDFLPVAEHADPAAYEAHIATPSDEVELAALWP